MNYLNYISYDILIWLGLIITFISQILIKTTYSKYQKQENTKRLTGFDVARQILDKNNLQDILILETSGYLSDHYDPTKKVIKLSTDIYHGNTISSVAVAAHECGHAIQDKEKYKPMKIRSKIVPTVNLFTKLGYLSIVIGAIFDYRLMEIGVILLLSILLFQIITLPVEFNASHRALKQIDNLNILSRSEQKGAKKVLIAAAFTYVAAVLTTLMQILRYTLIANSRRR